MMRKMMARKKRPSQKEKFIKAHTEIEKQKEDAEKNLPSITRDSGGSIDKLPVQTKAFNNWLTEHQNINPFIGKHVTSAPEFNTEQKELDSEEIEATDEMIKDFQDSEYNPNAEGGLQEEDLSNAPKVDRDSHTKFIDINIIENETRLLPGKTTEEIESHVIEKMKSYHDDENYESDIKIEEVIEHTKTLMIGSDYKKPKFLK